MSGSEAEAAIPAQDAGLADLIAWFEAVPLAKLMRAAEASTLAGHGAIVTYSRKVFIPLTRLCRDVCHYCTFATTPKAAGTAFMSVEDVLAIARAGATAGCREALFTLGDKPELRHPAARRALDRLGYADTLSYLRAAAKMVLAETNLLPHLNAGIMTATDYVALRPVAASMGLMLETTAVRLSAKGGAHFGSPDKTPAVRLASIAAAGEAMVPLTTGLLIGIGETHAERIEALVAIRDLDRAFGHIQEVIIQNFRAKPGTRMAAAPEPSLEDHLWTIAAARMILGPEMTIQAPPNLQRGKLADLLAAGVNDWGGVSPITPDHVNPEAPWPHLDALAATTAACGRVLTERLAIGPRHTRAAAKWLDPAIAVRVGRAVDARGLPMIDTWRAGAVHDAPELLKHGRTRQSTEIETIVDRVRGGEPLRERDIVTLFRAEGPDVARVADHADALRGDTAGEAVSYVVNRNINYTNICLYHCSFCAFSKGATRDARGPAYRLDLAEVGRRAAEAVDRGATELCLQGGIHPDFDGHTYLGLLEAVRASAPDAHIHAFSPLEIAHGARSLGQPLDTYLASLKAAGLKTLPGTAAEILDDEVRAVICPDKVSTGEWLDVMRAAHEIGLRSTATIMFGHVDDYRHWARHLLAVRGLQEYSGGFTEFVPLPFVHMEAPMWRKGQARSGPSYREALLMHAVARLALHPFFTNIQTSWVKMGPDAAVCALRAGANDLGGTLMDESITRAAGGSNGQHCGPAQMEELARRAGRRARQRTTLYGPVSRETAEIAMEA